MPDIPERVAGNMFSRRAPPSIEPPPDASESMGFVDSPPLTLSTNDISDPTTSLPLFLLSIVALTALGVGLEKYRRSRALKLSDDDQGSGWQMLDRLEREVKMAGGRVRSNVLQSHKGMVAFGGRRLDEGGRQVKLVDVEEEVDIVDEEVSRRTASENREFSQEGELRRRRSQDAHSDTDEDWKWGLPLIDVEGPQVKNLEVVEEDVVDQQQISIRTPVERRHGGDENVNLINVENGIELKPLKPSQGAVENSKPLVDLEEGLAEPLPPSSSYVPLVDIGKNSSEEQLVDVSPSPSSSDSLPFEDPWRPHPRINIAMDEIPCIIVPLVPEGAHSPLERDEDTPSPLSSQSPSIIVEKPFTNGDSDEESIQFQILPPTPMPVFASLPEKMELLDLSSSDSSEVDQVITILTDITTSPFPEADNSPLESENGNLQDAISAIVSPASISPATEEYSDPLPPRLSINTTSIIHPPHNTNPVVPPSTTTTEGNEEDFKEALSATPAITTATVPPTPIPSDSNPSDDPPLPSLRPTLPTPPTTPKRRALQPLDMNVQADSSTTPTTRPAWSIRASDAPPLGLPSTPKPSEQSPTSSTKTSSSPTSTSSIPTPSPVIPSPRFGRAFPALDLALAMQLRPGIGIGADPAWMVRYLMAMFGWFAILMSGRSEMRPTMSRL